MKPTKKLRWIISCIKKIDTQSNIKSLNSSMCCLSLHVFIWMNINKLNHHFHISDSKKSDQLIRPLPWVLFLPTLVALRYTRVILSLLSICLGYDEIEVSTMVAWLHQSRRTIRHIVHEAKRNEQKAAVATTQSHNYNNTSIDCFKRIILSLVSNLSGLIFSTPYTVAVHNNKTSVKISFISVDVREILVQCWITYK